jgi:hypothetical protein
MTIATAFAILFVAFALWGFWTMLFQPLGVDFLSFWSAGKLALHGNAVAAYDIAAHRAVEKSIVPRVGLLPFPYPPPFLIVVAPFALASFPVAFVIWVVITCSVYTYAAARAAPLPYAMANPPVLVDLLIGQTGLLVGGAFILGLTLVPIAPVAAGAVLGLLVIKPQLALMLPIAMVAGREWSVILGAILSSAAAMAASLVLFGYGAYQGFFQILPHYVAYMRQGSWNWAELASPFAFARYVGVNQSAALAIQGVAAVAAGMLTWVAWSRNWKEKTSIVAAASLLASPYLLTYDSVLLIVPAGYFVARGQYGIVGLLWVLCALPVLHFYDLYEGPNTIPVAALIILAILTTPHLHEGSAETRNEISRASVI